jgi:hypothetical protein
VVVAMVCGVVIQLFKKRHSETRIRAKKPISPPVPDSGDLDQRFASLLPCLSFRNHTISFIGMYPDVPSPIGTVGRGHVDHTC